LAEFEIFELPAGGGTLALSPAPGRGSYQHDLAAILRWGAEMVLTMTTMSELERLGAEGLGDDLEVFGITWRHLPIEDFGEPTGATAESWPEVEAEALTVLAGGGKVLTHCFGGCGRSGMAAMRLMVASGEEASAALDRLRTVRPCAIETMDQLAWAGLGT